VNRFVFGLQPVLDHRRHLEEQKRLTFDRCSRELQKERDALKTLTAEFDGACAFVRLSERELSAGALREHRERLRALQRRIDAGKAAVAQRAAELRTAAAELHDARRSTAVLERLRARRLEEHKRAEYAREERELDDLAGARSQASQ
jgi:flagellar export protein FliJ